MTKHKDDFPAGWWANEIEEVDHEIAKLAVLFEVRILDVDVIKRVLKKDGSVCGTRNPTTFTKLHDTLMLHIALREKSAQALGETMTERIEDGIVKRLRKSFPDLAGNWPPVGR